MTTDENGNYHIYAACTAVSCICSKCGKTIKKSCGQSEETMIEHLPILDKRVFIHVKWPRFKCSDCDASTTSFRPNWLNHTGQYTIEFEKYVLKNLINTTIKDTSEKLGLTEDIVEGVVNRNIITDYDWGNTQLTAIGLDEIALRKGHKQYLTIISDLSTKGTIRVLGVIKGRTKEEITPFLKGIPDTVLFGLESICMDMSASYFPALKERINDDDFFNKVVTIDRFHVAKLVGEKVDKERKQLINKLKEEFKSNDPMLEKIKGTMWLFRHHPKDLNAEQVSQLRDLFDLSPKLEECYLLREDLYGIFEKDLSKEEAKEEIATWIEKSQNHKSFQSFVETYQKYQENILNYFTYRRSSGPVEGLNNKIKVIKRRGFGFRNIDNFAKRIFLDINYKPQLIGVPA